MTLLQEIELLRNRLVYAQDEELKHTEDPCNPDCGRCLTATATRGPIISELSMILKKHRSQTPYRALGEIPL